MTLCTNLFPFFLFFFLSLGTCFVEAYGVVREWEQKERNRNVFIIAYYNVVALFEWNIHVELAGAEHT